MDIHSIVKNDYINFSIGILSLIISLISLFISFKIRNIVININKTTTKNKNQKQNNQGSGDNYQAGGNNNVCKSKAK